MNGKRSHPKNHGIQLLTKTILVTSHDLTVIYPDAPPWPLMATHGSRGDP